MQGVEDRAWKAEALETEFFAFEGLKTDIYNFRQELVAKRASLVKYLKILKQGVRIDQNRQAVAGTARRAQEKLTPNNLVRKKHKHGKAEQAKIALDDSEQVLGAFVEFSYAFLREREVAKVFMLHKKTQEKVDPGKLCVPSPSTPSSRCPDAPPDPSVKKVTYEFVALENGTYDVTVLYNRDTVIDAFELSVEDLEKRERAMKHEFVPESRLTGATAKTRFHVPSLIELLATELTTRRLVLK